MTRHPILLAALLLTGCGVDERVGTRSSAMCGGTEESHPRVGLMVNNLRSGYCTATLIRPHFVLTAAHCIAEAGATVEETVEQFGDGWTMTFHLDGRAYEAFPADLAVHPDYVKNKGMDPHNTVYVAGDYAVVRLAEDILDGAVPLAAPSLGQAVDQWGLGLDSEERIGVSHRTDIDVREVYSTFFLTVADEPGHGMVARGDSGGPTFDKQGNLVGIHSVKLVDTDTIAYEGTPPRPATGRETVEMRVDVVRTWIEGTTKMLDSDEGTDTACSQDPTPGRCPASGQAVGAEGTDEPQVTGGCNIDRAAASVPPLWCALLLGLALRRRRRPR